MASAPEDRKPPHKDDSRDQRLKVALRENLRRRKAQARGRVAEPTSAAAGEPPPSGKQRD
jgi:hypothetical protein